MNFLRIKWPFVHRSTYEAQKDLTVHFIRKYMEQCTRAGMFEKKFIEAAKNDKRDPITGRYTKL